MDIEPTKPSTAYKILEYEAKPYVHTLPNWCYDPSLALIDVQHIYNTNTVLYRFKTADGEVKYHKESDDEKYYYVHPDYKVQEDAPMLVPVSETCTVIKGRKVKTNDDGVKYEEMLRTELKRSIDYRMAREGIPEPDINLDILYFDIEVYSEGRKEFPKPEDHPSPVNAISYKYNNGPVHVLVYQTPTMDTSPIVIHEGELKYEYEIFQTEFDLLNAFADVICKYNPDIIAGWNIRGFDIPTLMGRMRDDVYGDINRFSPIGITSENIKDITDTQIHGTYVLDMLDLYKNLTYIAQESYRLDAIAQFHLGEGKIAYEGGLDLIYENNISKFLQYSATDTNLLYELNEVLGHIDLRFELVKICSSSWRASERSMGQIDPLCVSYAKRQNKVCRDSIKTNEEFEKIPGAYVRSPKPGIWGKVVDYDFTSLYPSIICSANIGPNTFVAKIDGALKDERVKTIVHNIIYDRESLNLYDKITLIIDPIKKTCKEVSLLVGQLIRYIEKNNYILLTTGCIYKSHAEELSFFNEILTYLMQSRVDYKNEMKTAKKAGQQARTRKLNNIQMAYKILANSLYGVLANQYFRMFNLDMAMSITLTGQEAIKFAGYHLNRYMETGNKTINPNYLDNYDDPDNNRYLIYTDTDSIFIGLGLYLMDKGVLDPNDGSLIE